MLIANPIYDLRPILAAAFGLALAFTFSCSSDGGGDDGGGEIDDSGVYIKAVAYGNGTFVAGGGSKIAYSKGN